MAQSPESEYSLVPSFELRLDGRQLDSSALGDVVRVTVSDDIDGIDGFLLELRNWDQESRTFTYSDRDAWLPGHRVQVAMGFLGREPLTPMIDGVITTAAPIFRAEDAPTLVLAGQGALGTLMKAPVSQVYGKVTDSQIAKAVAGRLGLSLRTGSGSGEPVQESVIQANLSDSAFLRERARRRGYVLLAEPAGGGSFRLYFGPPPAPSPAYTFTWGRNLHRFEPVLDVADQVAEVTVRAWDAVKKLPLTATATRSAAGFSGRLASLDGKLARAMTARKEVVLTRACDDQAQVTALANGIMADIAFGTLTAEGGGVGLPDMRAGATVTIEGLGGTYSGRWSVTATTHTIGRDGYQMTFRCRRDSV